MRLELLGIPLAVPADELFMENLLTFQTSDSAMSDQERELTKRILCIATVRNTGRAAIDVSATMIESGPRYISVTAKPLRKKLPRRLEAASEFTFSFAAFEAVNLLTEGDLGKVEWIRVRVGLGNGSYVESGKVLMKEMIEGARQPVNDK
ncbi:hypothetical protein [Amycolatopsis sp. TNS106]|uniref:hypothetical protein n=1 Tax=Amycolatopsis sp. TNS106 TaxID=2861750 RepID=UPI001C58B949|nr:hypothetical protein [Amycolatopsis sp. TNS106]